MIQQFNQISNHLKKINLDDELRISLFSERSKKRMEKSNYQDVARQQLYICRLLEDMNHIEARQSQKKEHLPSYHANYHISVKIPHKQHENDDNLLENTPSQQQVFILPLQSARIVTAGSKKRKINSEIKFISHGDIKLDSPLAVKRVAKIKNVVFRPKLQKFISQQKTRLTALQQTLMLQRQRRINKELFLKKIQRLMSPTHIKERSNKKFTRTEDKKYDQNKKFKRFKEKEESKTQQKLIQGKLIKKIREEHNLDTLSRIPEYNDQNYVQSSIKMADRQDQTAPMFSQTLYQSIIEQPLPTNDLLAQQSNR